MASDRPTDAVKQPTVAAAAAPLLIADDDDWHSIRCARVRDSEVVEASADIEGREHCPVCGLFADPSEVAR
jgi:hypothetical protein